MVSASDILHLPYTRDLTEGGVAYALHSLPYRHRRTPVALYDSLRRSVAGAAIQLAFRRYLAEQEIAFEVKGALPFTEHERYDVTLGGRRCELQSFLISRREQIAQIQRNPQDILQAPALVASDQHAGDGHSAHDLYLFAFLLGWIMTSQNDLQKVIQAKQPYYIIHVMPDAWNHPSKWAPLGRLALKSESAQTQTIEIGGQDAGREMRSIKVELPPRKRVEVQDDFFSLAYVHNTSPPDARIGIHSPVRKETHMIEAADWGNIWVYGMQVLLAGYITRDEFSRRASFIQAGTRVFQYDHTHVKNLAVPVSDLKPLAQLFERVK